MKTFRKSSLISSVALLLVAIVALSGATFAWFSSNDTTKAEGINITASSASGLYIIESDSKTIPGAAADWGAKVDFNFTKDEMAPTSSDFDGADPTFVKTSTERNDGKVWDTENSKFYDDVTVDTATANTDYVKKHIWVKGDGATSTTLNGTVTLTSTGAFQGYEKVAICDASTGAIIGGKVITPETDKAYYPLTTNGQSSTAIESVSDGTEFAIATDWVPNTGKHLIVYCWFEGQDDDCVNVNSGANLQFNISFALPKEVAQG